MVAKETAPKETASVEGKVCHAPVVVTMVCHVPNKSHKYSSLSNVVIMPVLCLVLFLLIDNKTSLCVGLTLMLRFV